MNLFDIDLSGITAFDFANMTPYELGRNVLLPFILVFVILWVILERIHVFGKKVNIIVSLGISILLATTPAFTMLSTYITEVSGTGMLVIFGLLLIGGTAMWALGRGRDIYYDVEPGKGLLKIRKKIRKLRDKYEKTNDPALLKQIRSLEDKEKQLEYELHRR